MAKLASILILFATFLFVLLLEETKASTSGVAATKEFHLQERDNRMVSSFVYSYKS
ncbi:hypothetical protein SAY87_013818 [Trapa incisa]|uniref:Uncharacterized protein n=1 Tax=Trapa incisa TaxID=236973 RepID=A0AAN7KK21_9MYRT|nr:hypothetical protein SAY87_013818 [Trapa incisa]